MGVEEGLGAAFPLLPEDWLDSAIFKLCYHQHGGSGLSFTASDVEDMEFSRIIRFCERLDEQREAEAAALRRPT